VEHDQLVEALIFLPLLLDALADGGFVALDRRDIVAACPRVLP
jgi:hypothetical protein